MLEVQRRTDCFWNVETEKGSEVYFNLHSKDVGRGQIIDLDRVRAPIKLRRDMLEYFGEPFAMEINQLVDGFRIREESQVSVSISPRIDLDENQRQVFQEDLLREAERRGLPRPELGRGRSLSISWPGLWSPEFSEVATLLAERLNL